MSIFNLNQWLNRFDPFYLKRLIFRKGLFIGILLVGFYAWLSPTQLGVYFLGPHILMSLYNNLHFNTWEKKYRALWRAYLIFIGLVMMFFFLAIHPWILIFIGPLVFALLLYWAVTQAPSFKPYIPLIFMMASIVMLSTPLGTMTGMLGLLESIGLAIFVHFLAYLLQDNLYGHVWAHSIQTALTGITQQLATSLGVKSKSDQAQQQTEQAFSILLSIKRLLPKQHRLIQMRIMICLSRLNMVMIYLSVDAFDTPFWREFYTCLVDFNQQVQKGQTYFLKHDLLPTTNSQQRLGHHFLTRTIKLWNRLCFAQ